ncbi:hypothetical protein HCEG_05938 [Histoplasma capsulatum var. duboisii H88]|uniref:Uncharacterized protein n=1 Tax=Ajellomyces capsulatus (strain H88) TaxID=544711 RepID=F0UKE2_AJEC8|nr:hypothetical protein HCEG_05938 [Histoplasma capsulatum var. duboisii H88]
MDPGFPHPPHPPPEYTSRPATPRREVDDFTHDAARSSTSAGPSNTPRGAVFRPQGEDILPNDSRSTSHKIAGNEDCIPTHILAESIELAELHRMALELTSEHGVAGNDAGSQYDDFGELDGAHPHGIGGAVDDNALPGYEDFVEPYGRAIPSVQTGIYHGRIMPRENASALGYGPANWFANAAPTLSTVQPGLATHAHANYPAPYGVRFYPNVHQVRLVGAGSIRVNAGEGNSNHGLHGTEPAKGNIAPPSDPPAAIVPANTNANLPKPPTPPTPPSPKNITDNKSASATSPPADGEYEDWDDRPGPPPNPNDDNAETGPSARIVGKWAILTTPHRRPVTPFALFPTNVASLTHSTAAPDDDALIGEMWDCD